MSETPADSFSADWLALREPADHAARDKKLTESLVQWMASQPSADILDLGTGTASNLRYLCPRLGHEQRWTLIDHDPLLLDRLPALLQSWCERENHRFDADGDGARISSTQFSAHLHWRQMDLSAELDALDFSRQTLVTGSALLDLVSMDWLRRLARQCLEARCASLFVLNYNGQVQWQPSIADDAFITDGLNSHQGSDKGFGPATGPTGGSAWAELLKDRQSVQVQRSDWQIDSGHRDLLRAIAAGWAAAASEADPKAAGRAGQWLEGRERHIDAGGISLTVGHDDVLSLPITE